MSYQSVIKKRKNTETSTLDVAKRPKLLYASSGLIVAWVVFLVVTARPPFWERPWTDCATCFIACAGMLYLSCLIIAKRNLIAIAEFSIGLYFTLWICGSAGWSAVVLCPSLFCLMLPSSIRWLMSTMRFSISTLIVSLLLIVASAWLNYMPWVTSHYIINKNPIWVINLGEKPLHALDDKCEHYYDCWSRGNRVGFCRVQYTSEFICYKVDVVAFARGPKTEQAVDRFVSEMQEECIRRFAVDSEGEIVWDRIAWNKVPMKKGRMMLVGSVEDKQVIRICPEESDGLLGTLTICAFDLRLCEGNALDQDKFANKDKRSSGATKNESNHARTEEERLSAECERLAVERMQDVAGGGSPAAFCVCGGSLSLQFSGENAFVERFERAVSPLAGHEERVLGKSARRKVLYEQYVQLNRALDAARGRLPAGRGKYSFDDEDEDHPGKDEFETVDEYKARIKNDERAVTELQVKHDKALDEIVDLEQTCSPKLLRASANGYYDMEEALVFVPNTEWTYDADKRQFDVSGKKLSDDHNLGYADSRRSDTFQAFHFPIGEIRVSQFVRSNDIHFNYKLASGIWNHPRAFKEYKQRHPFLLLRLGPCDFKVQGTSNWMMTMPWSQDANGRKDENKYACSRASTDAKAIWRDIQAESLVESESIFMATSCTVRGEELTVKQAFADFESSQGRAEIEAALAHFEKVGGSYYKSFCKAVRVVLNNDR